MLMTRNFSSAAILVLLLLSVNAATMTADEVDFTDDSAKAESNVDTYPQMFDVFVKDGKVISSNNEINVNTDASIETDGKKQYWKLDEYATIDFSFSLPLGVKNVRVELNCISTEEIKGKAIVRWNGKNHENDKGERETINFEGKNFQHPLVFKSCSEKNTLRVMCQEGTIGIQSVSVHFDSPLPSWDSEDKSVTITLLNPLPDWVYSGSQVELDWKSTGSAEEGWLKVEYRTAGQQDWKTVPGLEGTTYGQDVWRDNKGHFVWNNPPKTPKCEYRFTYTRGKNPIEEKREADRLRQEKCAKIALDLAKRKWDFLKKTDGIIDKKYWKEIPDHEKKDRESQDLIIRLGKQFKDLEENKQGVDLNTVSKNLSDLEIIYFEVINAILLSASVQNDVEKSNTYADIANGFLRLCDQAYKSAKYEYENDADAKDLLQEFFPREIFKTVKDKLEKVNNLISEEQKRFTAALELATMKWEFLQESTKYIDSTFWKEKLSEKYNTANSLIEKITPQFEILSSSNDSKLRNNELNSAIKNMSRLEALYDEAVGIMLSAILEQDNIEKNEKYVKDIADLEKFYDETSKKALKIVENDKDNQDLLLQFFPKDKSFFKDMKPRLEAEIWYQKAEKSASAKESEARDWNTAKEFYLKAADSGHIQAMVCLGNYYNEIAKDFNEAVEWYRKAAEQGNAQAQYKLGDCYFNGNGIAQDYEEAIKLYRKAAEQGDVQAQYKLGDCYFNGNGIAQDYEEAIKLYRKAAEQGNAQAQCDLGACYFDGDGVAQDYEEAVAWYRKAAEQGNAQAQYKLGVCYFDGDGVPQNKAEGINWYRKAAEQGYAPAQNDLGCCYFNGDGVPENKAEAVVWYRKAAEQGVDMGQFNLGGCYFNGDGVPQNKAEGIKWWHKAAEQGDDQAQYSLGYCYFNGDGVPQNKAEGINWLLKAAEQGHAPAQWALGGCYFNGDGVPQNKAEGIKWWHKAAEQGYAPAQYDLGCCYFDGDGFAVDKAEGIKWWHKAAEQGHVLAQYDLGGCYFAGDGVPENKAEAVAWLRKAAEQGYARAQYSLGFCYFDGIGVPENKAEAVAWFRKAAEQGDAQAQFELGNFYFRGIGVPENKAEAVAWHRKAAEQGYAPAQWALSCCYCNGDGVPQNKAEWINWLHKAAEQGYQPAIEVLKRINKKPQLKIKPKK